jgi:GDP-L-fucose synthase
LNIGTGDIYSIKQLVNIIAKKIRYKGKIIFNPRYPNGVMKKNIDIKRIKKLNWHYKFDLSSGLNKVLSEFKF